MAQVAEALCRVQAGGSDVDVFDVGLLVPGPVAGGAQEQSSTPGGALQRGSASSSSAPPSGLSGEEDGGLKPVSFVPPPFPNHHHDRNTHPHSVHQTVPRWGILLIFFPRE